VKKPTYSLPSFPNQKIVVSKNTAPDEMHQPLYIRCNLDSIFMYDQTHILGSTMLEFSLPFLSLILPTMMPVSMHQNHKYKMLCGRHKGIDVAQIF